MQKLFIADVTESKRQEQLESKFEGEVFNFNSVMLSNSITVQYYKAGETVSLHFSGSFSVRTVCDRCGEDVALEVDFTEDFYIFPAENNEDMDYVYSDDYIDLENYAHESIVINFPTKVLCDDNCQGRCPVCGKNNNDNKCNCAKDIT